MALSNELISQFAKATNDTKKQSSETTYFGTIVEYDGGYYAKLDGSEQLTPILTTAKVVPGERVTVLVKNHSATVTGNITSPSASDADVVALDGKVTQFGTVLADKVDTKVLIAETARIDALYAENATITGTLTAQDAVIKNLEVDNINIKGRLDVNEANIGTLNADNANIKGRLDANEAHFNTLDADVADINTLIFGSASGTSIQTSFANAVIAQLGTAQIKSAMIDSVAADKITAGDIITNNVRVMSEDGSLIISDETIQISDDTRVRVQIGKDASNDYSINIWDANGKLMFSEGGITDNAIKEAIIRNDMVAANANISGSKLDIQSVYSAMNADGSSTLNATKVYLDEKGQSLDVAFTSMTTDISNLTSNVSSQGTQISAIQGQISSKIWQEDIESALGDIALDGVEVGGRNLALGSETIMVNPCKYGDNPINTSTRNGQTYSVNGRTITNPFEVSFISGSTGDVRFYRYDGNNNGSDAVLKMYDLSNKTYTMSVWVMSDVYCWLASYVTRQYNDSDGDSKAHELQANKWTRIVHSRTFSSSSDLDGIRVRFVCDRTANIVFCLAKVELGNVATDWTPAPEDMETQVTTLNTQYSNLVQDLTSITATVGQHTTQIANKADNSKVTEVSNKVTEVSANLEGFKTTVSNTYTTKTEFDNLSVGGRNYISNLQSNWGNNTTAMNNGNNTHMSEVFIASNKRINLKSFISVEAMTDYIFSIESLDGKSYKYELANYNADGYYLGGAKWERETVKHFNTGETRHMTLLVSYNDDSAIDPSVVNAGFRVKLEKGNKVTDWTPAPEDNPTKTEMNSAIDVKANAITSSVSATYTTKTDFNNLSIGGNNLLKDTNVLYTRKSSNTDYPSYSFYLVDGYDYKRLIGKSLTYSFWLHSAGSRVNGTSSNTQLNGRFGCHLSITWVDSTGAKANYTEYPLTTLLAVTNTRSRVSGTITVTPPSGYDTLGGFNVAMQIYAKPASGNNETWEIGYPKLEFGNRATDWSPSSADLEKRVTNAETRITQTEKDITAEVTERTNLATRVSTVEQTASGLTVTLNETKNNLANLSVGGRNLIKGTSESEIVLGGYPSSSYTEGKTGYSISPLTKDKYVLSFDAKSTVSGDKIRCHFYSPNTTTKVESSTGYTGTASDGTCDIVLTTTWTRYWIKYTQTGSSSGSETKDWIIGRRWVGWGTGSVSIRSIKLEEGHVPTDWSPAPEDTDSLISAAQSTANTANSTANTAKTNAATAQSTANTANTKATNAQNDINSMAVGIRNYVLNSNKVVTNKEYCVSTYDTSEPLIAGETYTWTMCFTPASSGAQYKLYFSNGYINPSTIVPSGTGKQTISKTFTMSYYSGRDPSVDASHAKPAIYRFPNDGTVTGNTTIHWIKIEKGSKATAWQPASEATNYLNFSSSGLVVGDMTASTLGRNVLIHSTGVNIRNNTSVLASFTDNKIELGKNNRKSVIDLCDGVAQIRKDDDAIFGTEYNTLALTASEAVSIYTNCMTSMTASFDNSSTSSYAGMYAQAASPWETSNNISGELALSTFTQTSSSYKSADLAMYNGQIHMYATGPDHSASLIVYGDSSVIEMVAYGGIYMNSSMYAMANDIYIGNGVNIRGYTTTGGTKRVLALSSNNNLVIGYDNYDMASGSTNIYGNDIHHYIRAGGVKTSYKPYYEAGDSGSGIWSLAGFITSSSTSVFFTVFLGKPIVGDPTITVTSTSNGGLRLRQGGKYTHGSSSDTYVKPSSYSAALIASNAIRITASMPDVTNAINNDTVGIFASINIAFS